MLQALEACLAVDVPQRLKLRPLAADRGKVLPVFTITRWSLHAVPRRGLEGPPRMLKASDGSWVSSIIVAKQAVALYYLRRQNIDLIRRLPMIPRTLFEEDHEAFRDTVRRFMEQEVAPHHARWEEQSHVDREIWTKAGAPGFLCATMPEEYGGAGVDKRFSVVVMEEAARINATGLGWGLHSEIVAPYLLHYGSEALKQKYLPKMASGEMIGAIAMTEPGAGSDLQGVRTTAVKDGDHYVLNGSKTFITNGYLCDLVIVVAKTDPAKGAKGTSLLVVDTSMPGFTKRKPLHKAGMKAQDTCELFFDNVRCRRRTCSARRAAASST
jgi:alkylation response protein AidB-like acyl-CoA dehydrogenase